MVQRLVFLVSGTAMLAGFSAFLLLVLHTRFPAAWTFLFFAVFCLFSTPPNQYRARQLTHLPCARRRSRSTSRDSHGSVTLYHRR